MPVSANAGEYRSKIGLDSLYIAAVTQDDTTAYVADTPEIFAPAAEANQAPQTSFEVQFADDKAYDVMTGEGETQIQITVTGIPVEMLAKITGKVFNAASGRIWENPVEAPFIALSFRSLKSNGKYRYYQYLKGKFDMPQENTATKGDTPDPKTLTLTYTAIQSVYKWNLGSVTNSVKRIVGDEDTTSFSATGWFTSVQTPSWSAPAALSLSSSIPTDGATGISVSANQSLTFNNALVNEAVNMVSLFVASSGVLVAMAATYPQLSGDKKTVTLDPASNLTAATAYIIAANVKDIYGQWLQVVINFTTA